MHRPALLGAALLMAALLTIAATAAQAHTGIGDANGVVYGVAHPLAGIDHVLVMVAVGVFAAHLGGRALWLVPLSFVSMMTVGGVLGMAGVGLPLVEVAIGFSVVAVGLAVAVGFNTPIAAAMALVGFFAVFHGQAHGVEMPETISGLEYGIGFVMATASLHALGIGLGISIRQTGKAFGNGVLQVAGSAMALAGIAILTGYM